MDKIPKEIERFLVPFDKYLERETTKCESIFYFNNNNVCGSLGNPLLDDKKPIN